MAKKSASKGRVISVDWTDVEVGGGASLVDEGNYEVKVMEVEKKTGSDSGEDYLAWQFEILSPEEFKGNTLYYNTSLQKKSLWNLRGLLEVLGIEIPEGEGDLDLDELIDRTAGCEVQHEKYNGKDKNSIVDFFEFKDEDEDEEKPAKASKKKKVTTIKEEDILEKDEDELQQTIDENGLDLDLDDFNTLRRKRAAVVEALEEEGLIEAA